MPEIDALFSQNCLTEIEESLTERLSPLVHHGLNILNSPTSISAAYRAELLFYFAGWAKPRDAATPRAAIVQASYRFAISLQDQRTHRNAYPFALAIHQLIDGFRPQTTQAKGGFSVSAIDYEPYTEEETKRLWAYVLSASIPLLVQ